MPPDLQLAHTGVATTGHRVDVGAQPEGCHHKGRILRWSGGVYAVELPDAEALKLLKAPLAHYAVPATPRPRPGRATRLDTSKNLFLRRGVI